MKKEFKDRIEYRDDLGQLHREDGPAVEWYDGAKSWYINDKLHRIDGPAIDWDGTYLNYYFDGKWYSKEDWEQIVKLKAFI